MNKVTVENRPISSVREKFTYDFSSMYEFNEITKNLCQGGLPPIGSWASNAGFDTVVLAAKEHIGYGTFGDLLYLGVNVVICPTEDTKSPNRIKRMVPLWKEASDIVVSKVRDDKSVLVTCIAGQNRSSMVVAYALRELTGMSGEKIVETIQRARPVTFSNEVLKDYVIDEWPDDKLVSS